MENRKNICLNRMIYNLGTGKTGTLVAVIEEILYSSNQCVLVCANSNSACDELTSRLLKVSKKKAIFRMYAKSYNPAKMGQEIEQCSNYHAGQFTYPSLEYLYEFRVVICTLLTAGHIMRV